MPIYSPSFRCVLTSPTTEGRLSLSRLGCLVLHRGGVAMLRRSVTHPGTNRAWRRVTMLIETNVIPLSHTGNNQSNKSVNSSLVDRVRVRPERTTTPPLVLSLYRPQRSSDYSLEIQYLFRNKNTRHCAPEYATSRSIITFPGRGCS